MVRTVAPIDGRAGLHLPNYFRVVANVPLAGHSEHHVPLLAGQDGIFGPEWHGYHYEAVGLLRRLKLDGLDYAAPAPGPRGPTVRWEIQQADTGLPLVGAESSLSLAPWLVRAFKPEPDGSEPALVAELRWLPQYKSGLWPFMRVNLHQDQRATVKQLQAAEEARELLMGVEQRMEHPTWPRSKSQDAFIRKRGQRLADYCRERGVSDPITLTRPDVAEAIGYASEESMRNALNTARVTTEHIKAEAYRLLHSETR